MVSRYNFTIPHPSIEYLLNKFNTTLTQNRDQKEMESNMRKTKIICTLGPATDKNGIIKDLILQGMDVARFNFSHGDHNEHLQRLKKVQKLRDELNIPVATLMDTKGPEVRIGNFKEKKVQLKAGQLFSLTTRDVEGDETGFIATIA